MDVGNQIFVCLSHDIQLAVIATGLETAVLLGYNMKGLQPLDYTQILHLVGSKAEGSGVKWRTCGRDMKLYTMGRLGEME